MANANDAKEQAAAIVKAFRSVGAKHINKQQARKVKVAFRCDDLLEGSPSLLVADFNLPRLRQCPLDPSTINWSLSSPIGGGRDGYVWKVWFGENGPYAFKMVSLIAENPSPFLLLI